MFVRSELLLDVAFATARASLASLPQDGWLQEASAGAYDDTLAGLARVGPFGDAPGMSKLVRVYVRQVSAHAGEDKAVLALRWEAVGWGGSLFPALDADLTLTPAGPDQSLLTLDGAYRPPLGALGDGLDKVILHQVATSTMSSFLKAVARVISGNGPQPDLRPGSLGSGCPEQPR